MGFSLTVIMALGIAFKVSPDDIQNVHLFIFIFLVSIVHNLEISDLKSEIKKLKR